MHERYSQVGRSNKGQQVVLDYQPGVLGDPSLRSDCGHNIPVCMACSQEGGHAAVTVAIDKSRLGYQVRPQRPLHLHGTIKRTRSIKRVLEVKKSHLCRHHARPLKFLCAII